MEGEDKDMNVKEEQNGVELLCEEVEEPFKFNISEEVIDEYLIEENQEKEKLELEETSKLNTTEVPLDPKRYVEKKYVCSICGFRNINKWRLKRHFESCRRKFEKYNPGAAAHEGVKYPCNQCDQKFTQQSSLQTHIQSKHEGIKYPCNQCDYQATTRGHLQTHI